MAYETILFSIEGAAARLTLNRPDRLNSFTVQMHDEVRDALDRVEADKSVRVLLITGAGRGFCAGQDLADRAVAPGGDNVDLGESLEDRYNPLIRRLTSLEMPVICAVNGVAAGAGVNIALAADIVIAAKSAKFIQSFIKIGLIPDSGGTHILPRLVGMQRAAAMTMLGDKMTSEEAQQLGLIYKVVDDEQLMEEAIALAEKLAQMPTVGLGLTKRGLNHGLKVDLPTQLEFEAGIQAEAAASKDYKEGVNAFLEKRKPVFKGK